MDIGCFGHTGPEDEYEICGMSRNEHIFYYRLYRYHDELKGKVEGLLQNPVKRDNQSYSELKNTVQRRNGKERPTKRFDT